MPLVPTGEPAAPEVLDVRLAAGAAVRWMVLAGLLDRSTTFVVALAVLTGLLGFVLLSMSRVFRAAASLALIAFCCAAVLLPLAGRLAHARAGTLFALSSRHVAVQVTATVITDAVRLAARGVGGRPRVSARASVAALEFGGGRLDADGQLVVIADERGWQDVLPGQQVEVGGTLEPDRDGSPFSATLFARAPPRRIAEPPWYQRAAGHIRERLRSAVAGLPDQVRGLLPGLVDGDTAQLDPVLADHFRVAGLSHLVAVSGTNCTILVAAALFVLRRARVRPWVAVSVSGLVLAMFVVVARGSPSVLRAASMAAIALVAFGVGRPRRALAALSAAVLVLLVWDSTLAVSVSFLLSVSATAALLVIAPGWARALRRRGWPAGLAEAVAVASAAHLATAPIIAAMSGRVSVVAIAANVLAEPVVAVVTILGFLAALIGPVWLSGAASIAWVAGWPCRWLVIDADFFGGLHGALLPWPGGGVGAALLIGTTLVVAAIASRVGTRRVLAAATATALCVLLPVRAATSGWPPPGWRFVACDIGQGDALVLAAGPGAAVVVDAGPDPVLVDRCLSDLGITRIPLLVITHFHLDHVAGVAGVTRGRTVGQILTSSLAAPEPGVAIVGRIARNAGIPLASVQTANSGRSIDVGNVHLEVLGPLAQYHHTHSDPNNSSVLLRATVGDLRIILPGDAEVQAQRDLVASGSDVRADVLKVPHHGSSYFDPEFLAATHAAVAVISVGLGNDYGHPSPLLLAELAKLAVPAFRTDLDGDVAVVGSPGDLHVEVHRKAGSVVGAPRVGPASPPRRSPVPVASSAQDARMARWRPARSIPTSYPSRCHRCFSSSATRSSGSSARSARSPPRPAVPTPRSSRRSWTAVT